jgi:translocation and assembly module TamB
MPASAGMTGFVWKVGRWIGGLVLALVALVAAAIVVIDTDPGHRFLADRIAALRPASGLRIEIGRIDGSLWGAARLRDVRLYDPRGLFFEVPELELDWRPAAGLANRLDIRRLETDLAILHRLPKLRDTGRKGPILPGFDIRIARLKIASLRIEPAVTGVRRAGRIEGRADIRDGRAMVKLMAVTNAGDRLALDLDAAPDRDGFDLALDLRAPTGSVIGAIIGTERPVAARIAGDGRWKMWRGAAIVDVSGNRIVDLALAVREGRYALSGELAPAPILKGKLQRLSSPRILVTGQATLADRRLDTVLALRSAAVTIDATGVIDLATSGFDGMRINARLLRPPALFPNMTGRNIALVATLDGPFATAGFDYVLTADRAAFDNTGFEVVRAEGRGAFSKSPVKLPVRLTARRVTGVGDMAGGILANLRVEGVLLVTATDVRGQGMALRSDKLNGKLALFLDLRTGKYDVIVSGGLTRYFIPGIGIVDVTSDLKVVPGPGGRGTQVEGKGRAVVRRFDNAFLRYLAGGLPRIDTRLVRGPDGIIRFRNLVLTGPSVRITGNGLRRRDGTFQFEGAGTQTQYGPFTLALDGNISRPRIALLLARPLAALALKDVQVDLTPNPAGFAYTAAGGSGLGPFASDGQILLPANAPATIGVARLTVARTTASGAIQSQPGGFLGALNVSGGGVSGEILFRPVQGVQEIETKLAAREAEFPGPPATTMRRGRMDMLFRLEEGGMGVRGTFDARGLRRGQFSISRATGDIALADGRGRLNLSLGGSRGRRFEVKGSADIAPDRWTITGDGQIDGRPLRLTSPAVITRDGEDWALARTNLTFNGGAATLAGRYGATIAVDAGLTRMPLSVLDILYPRLGLGGIASGRLRFNAPRDGTPPTGEADLRVRGLTRSGLILSSRPIDVGLTARLDANALVARAVGVSEGKTVGRAQARIAPLPGGRDLAERLLAAPLFAQLRYNGPADTLWRLGRVETIDLSGPVAVAADIRGTLGTPLIRGSLRSSGGRLESAITGTVITDIGAVGSFSGSRLTISSFSGATRGGGKVSGSGSFNLAAAEGFGMDLKVEADRAMLLNRDDIGATVTGPLRLTSEGSGGLIAGEVKIDRGRFRLGQTAAITEIPRLNVTEVNRGLNDESDDRPVGRWNLDLKASARNQLMVTGLGLDSEWRADLLIKGTADNPAINGRADLIRGGYEFAGRRFDLERGAIRFLGQQPPDPVLDIAARADVQGLNATITVTGTGQKPDIGFNSIPALPEDELLSRLLFGTSITNLSAPEALQLAAAVAALQGGGDGGLNPINAVRNAAGLDRLRILPADVTQGQRTSIAAGKYITRRVYAEVITDGQGYSATRVEFQITRWLSLLSSISTLGRTSGNVRVSKDY